MWTRREWIGNAAGASLLPWTGLTTGCSSPNAGVANNAQGEFEPDVVIKLSATITYASIWAGKKTHLLKFVGEVVEGRKSALRDSGSFLGPTLDFVQGEKIRILFENKLLEPTMVHWHGMIVPEAADGHRAVAIHTNSKSIIIQAPIGIIHIRMAAPDSKSISVWQAP